MSDKINFYLKKINKNPRDYRAHLSLAKAYFEKDKYKDGLTALIWAHNLAPEDFEVNYFLALGYFKQANFDKAKKFVKLALDIRPRSLRVKELYQQIKIEIKHIEYTQEALKRMDKTPEVKDFDKFSSKEISNNLFMAAPYKFCDHYCQDCLYKGLCAVYKKRKKFEDRCKKAGKDPEDLDVILSEIEELIDLPGVDINKEAMSMGVDIRVVSKGRVSKEKKKHKKIITSKVFLTADRFTSTALDLVDSVFISIEDDPLLAIAIKDEMDKLLHYSKICLPKIYQALHIFESDKDMSLEDLEGGYIDMAIAEESVLICHDAVKTIAKIGETAWTISLLELVTNIENLKVEILRGYPMIKDYKQKILINANKNN